MTGQPPLTAQLVRIVSQRPVAESVVDYDVLQSVPGDSPVAVEPAWQTIAEVDVSDWTLRRPT